MTKKAIITGINGQDGSYLAELLLKKGYEVYGIVRRSSLENKVKMKNVANIKDKIHLIACSLENNLAVYKVFKKIMPDECYHLAASSFVGYSIEDDLSIMTNNFNTTYNILSTVIDVCPKCRVYFAGSSEIFGNADCYPQSESTRYNPRSVYGISKLSSHCLVKTYRKLYGIYACTGFTYNHESPRRGLSFVTRKISSAVAGIYLGREDVLEMGNLDARRDWGYAPDFVNAMFLMLQQDVAKDYVISTGKLHSVKELLEIAFEYVGLDYKKYVVVNEAFIRPAEKIPLVGDSLEIYKELGWKNTKDFKEMIQEMVDSDIKRLSEKAD